MGNCLRPQWFWYMIMLQASNHRNCLGKPYTTHPFSKQPVEAWGIGVLRQGGCYTGAIYKKFLQMNLISITPPHGL